MSDHDGRCGCSILHKLKKQQEKIPLHLSVRLTQHSDVLKITIILPNFDDIQTIQPIVFLTLLITNTKVMKNTKNQTYTLQ